MGAGAEPAPAGEADAEPGVRKPDWYIDQIADIMCRGAWIRGTSRRRLAKEWGLPVSTVANYATVAAKIVKSGTDDEVRDELRTVTVEKLQIIAAKAEAAARYGDAVRSLRVLNELTGGIQSSSLTMVQVNVGTKLTMPVSAISEFAERAHQFFVEVHPELLDEFMRFVGVAATTQDSAPLLVASTDGEP